MQMQSGRNRFGQSTAAIGDSARRVPSRTRDLTTVTQRWPQQQQSTSFFLRRYYVHKCSRRKVGRREVDLHVLRLPAH
jgi:hypothetical protein